MAHMAPRANPFDSLYVTESIDPESFAAVFSPFLVHDTVGLFHPGNVILVGTQGSGKSMLLTLLKPETRVAFARAGVPFPLDKLAPPFVGAGINLTRSGATDFGQRTIAEVGEEPGVVTAYFGDFLNYWIVGDLLNSIKMLASSSDNAAAAQSGLDPSRFDGFARQLAKDDCWSGALSDVNDMAGLTLALTTRIRVYRDYFNYNIDAIPPAVRASKSAAGEPISVAADALRTSGAMDDAVELFIRIDQYEELAGIEEWRGAEDHYFDAVVHKMLGLRDPRVSYRIGTRRHCWPERPRILGTTAVLEELRNFKLVDLDDILASQEHRKPFGRFAEDVFRRRLQWAGYDLGNQRRALTAVFGRSPTPEERASLYVRSGRYTPSLPADWPGDLRNAISEIARTDPLSARLAEAYGLQNDPTSLARDRNGQYPWDSRTWWRKERLGQALLQIAAGQRQRMVWSGKDDMVALAGSNILVFISLCQTVWDSWLRNKEVNVNDTADELRPVPEIHNVYVQDAGIQQASRYWFTKIRSDPDGDRRQRFVNYIGPLFREQLRQDLKMSYPGHNGFSLDVGELETDPEVLAFLREAAAFGVLIDRLHSTRAKRQGRRQKWYLAPIYSPYFQLPVAHVKEPRYVRVAEVRRWLERAAVLRPPAGKKARPRSAEQPRLFS